MRAELPTAFGLVRPTPGEARTCRAFVFPLNPVKLPTGQYRLRSDRPTHIQLATTETYGEPLACGIKDNHEFLESSFAGGRARSFH